MGAGQADIDRLEAMDASRDSDDRLQQAHLDRVQRHAAGDAGPIAIHDALNTLDERIESLERSSRFLIEIAIGTLILTSAIVGLTLVLMLR